MACGCGREMGNLRHAPSSDWLQPLPGSAPEHHQAFAKLVPKREVVEWLMPPQRGEPIILDDKSTKVVQKSQGVKYGVQVPIKHKQ